MTTTRQETTELSICVDCLYLLANGQPESVDPSWCPTDSDGRTGYHNGVPCDGTCEGAVSAHAEAVNRIWEGYELTLGSVECEWCGSEAREADDQITDCEPHFSMSQCDGCGSRLGGDRVHAVAWEETTQPTGDELDEQKIAAKEYAIDNGEYGRI